MRDRLGQKTQHYLSSVCLLIILTIAVGTAAGQDISRLTGQLSTEDPEQKRNALFELRNMRTADASRVAALALSDSDPAVRATAVAAVVFLPAEEAVGKLVPLLGDRDEFVRREAAFAMGVAGSAAASQPLLKLLQNERVIEVRNAAIAALGPIGDPSAVPTLVTLLREKAGEDNEFTRRSVARSIGQIAQIVAGGPRVAITPENFLPLKYKDDARALPAEYRAIFLDAERILIRILDSNNEAADTRREAAFALGAIGSTTAADALMKAAAGSDPYLSETAKEALFKIKSTREPDSADHD